MALVRRSRGPKPDILSNVVTANVDVADVQVMIDKVMFALRGENLERFLFEDAHRHFEEEIVQRFAYEGDRKSGNWPELSEATQDIRSREGFGPDWPINIRTEEMFQTVTQEADFWSAENYAEMMLPGSAAQGVVAQKIRTAQQGNFKSNPMSPNFGPTPPRPVLAADESDLQEVLIKLTRFIMDETSALL